ncbi:MAG: hypothetical protein Q9208_003438 [Pyrenodesmia sp. 3 TL-2023]
MASFFFSPVYDALVFKVKESDTRRRVKLLFLMLIYGHCYIAIYRIAVAAPIYFDGRNTSPSFWYSVLGALGAGTVFHLIDEGCCRITRHHGSLESRQEKTDSGLEGGPSNAARRPFDDYGQASHQPLPQQPVQNFHNPIQEPANISTLVSLVPSKPNFSIETLKSCRVRMDDPCHKVLREALRKYNMNSDGRRYDLYIQFGDQDRRLDPEEKPWVVLKQLDKAGRWQMFMVRRKLSFDAPAVAA